MKKNSSILLTVLLILLISIIPASTVVAESQDSLIDYSVTTLDSITQSDIDLVMQNDAKLLLQDMQNNPTYYGIKTRIENLSLGSCFQFASYSSSGEISYADNIVYYPVCSKGNIVAILSLCKSEGTVFCSLGIDFAPTLNDLLNRGAKSLALVDDCGTLYAIDPSNNASALANVNTNRLLKMNKKENYQYTLIAGTKNISKKEDPSTYSYSSYRPGDILSASSQGRILAASLTTKVLAYPIVDQNIGGIQYPICWAAATASIARYEIPSLYYLTAKNVCDISGHAYSGAQNTDVVDALEYFLPVSSGYNISCASVLTQTKIKSTINNNDPTYMRSSATINGTKEYHGTALCGYQYSSTSFLIYLMDPAYACIKVATYSGGQYKYAFGTYTFTWVDSVTIK